MRNYQYTHPLDHVSKLLKRVQRMDKQAHKEFLASADKLERKLDTIKNILYDNERQKRKNEMDAMLRSFHKEVEKFVWEIVHRPNQSFDFSRYGASFKAKKVELKASFR